MSKIICDLHIHTYFSDGRPSPQELIQHASDLGLKHISITDHDNIRGLVEALPLGAQTGIEVIPGIELTCRWGKSSGRLDSVDEGDIDLLGYYFDPQNPSFLRLQEASLADVVDRIAECTQRISKSGCPISLEDAYSQNPRYAGATQVINALWQGRHCVAGWEQALALFNREWAKVRQSKLTLEKAIDAIHDAGGVAVLAHPNAIRCSRGWIQPVHLYHLVSLGLDGIEIYHPRLNETARAYFMQLASRFNLLITGGSDEHGWPQGFPRLGSQPVTIELVEALKQRSSNSKSNSKGRNDTLYPSNI
jgi:hypothetical protein